MNFWKQTTHVMAYFNTENFRGADRLPDSFMKGFLEVSPPTRSLPDIKETPSTAPALQARTM